MRTVLLLFLTSTARAQQSKFILVASINQLMKGIVNPPADVIFEIAMKAPKNDEEWIAMQNNTLTLAKSRILLMIGNRAKEQGDDCIEL